MKKVSFFFMIFFVLMSAFSQDLGKQNRNKYSLNTGSGYQFVAVVKNNGGNWFVDYLAHTEELGQDFRRKIKLDGGEILMARNLGGSWDFEPYFDVVSPDQKPADKNFFCNKKIPYRKDKNFKYDTGSQTNICDSLFMTDSDQDTSLTRKVTSTAIMAVFTAGITLAAQAVTLGDQRYLDKKELSKAIDDTKLDELLNLLIADFSFVNSNVARINKSNSDKVSFTSSNLLVVDDSGWLKKPTMLDAYANSFAKYSVVSGIRNADFFVGLPKTLSDHEAWRVNLVENLSKIEGVKPTIRAQCPLNNIKVGGIYRVNVTCPANFEYTGLPVNVSVQLTGIELDLLPAITVADSMLKVTLSDGYLKFENLTSEFLEIRDISFGVNSKVFTLSSPTGSSQLTLGPLSSYPRTTETNKFPLSAISDHSMLTMFYLRNAKLQAAKDTNINLSLAVRYVTENTTATKTVRGLHKTNAYDMVMNSGKL